MPNKRGSGFDGQRREPAVGLLLQRRQQVRMILHDAEELIARQREQRGRRERRHRGDAWDRPQQRDLPEEVAVLLHREPLLLPLLVATGDGGPPVHALFVWCSNPVLSLPNAGAIRRGLARDDLFTVVSEQFLTDTARYADVVFPAATQLEQLDVVPAWGHLHLGWNEPAIEPPGEAVPNTELWRRLAGAFGLDDPRFALDDEALIRLALTGVDVDELRRRGFLRLPHPEPLTPYVEGGFPTPSGKAELWAGDLHDSAARVPDHLVADEGPAPVAGEGGRHPLSLLTPKVHQRFLNTTYSHHHGEREGGGPWVELDPADADARGLADGDLARVANDRGHLDLPVRFSERLRPGVALVPWGWWGDDRAANLLTSDRPTDWGDGVAYLDTRVEVTPVPT